MTVVDPVEVLGFVGLLCGLSLLALAVRVIAVECGRARRRRAARRARELQRASRVRLLRAGAAELWVPDLEWDQET